MDVCGGGICKFEGFPISAVVSNCIIENNEAAHLGGGAFGVTIYDSVIRHNVATNRNTANGGGCDSCVIYNSWITGNVARVGGGLGQGSSYNSIVAQNHAIESGGGTVAQFLYNCTVVDNTAASSGGGIRQSASENGIIYHNHAPSGSNRVLSSMVAHSCIAPLLEGDGNIDVNPMFVDWSGGNYRLQSNSPCIDAGITNALAVDIEGLTRPWDGDGDGLAVNDMGAHEFGSYVDGDFKVVSIDIDSVDEVSVAMTAWRDRIYGIQSHGATSDDAWVHESGATNILGLNGVLLIVLSNQSESVRGYRGVSE